MPAITHDDWLGPRRYGRDMYSRGPRGSRFESPRLDIVWVAIEALDATHQCIILRELATSVAADGLGPSKPLEKVRPAIRCLHDLADLLGRSPTQYEYRQAAQIPELDLMPESTLRRRLGGTSWNDCLRRALLSAVSDGDFTTKMMGSAFTQPELIEALVDYARDHDGRAPTFPEFLAWSQDPEVQTRPGRRPRSHRPFARFGGFPAVLKRSGLDLARLDRGGRIVPAAYAYSDEELLVAVATVARGLGRSPRLADYRDAYARAAADVRGGGSASTLPTPSALPERFGPWPNVIAAACLPPLDGSLGPRNKCFRKPRYSPEAKLEWIRRAWVVRGAPLTMHAYAAWRRDELGAAEATGGHLEIPSLDAIVYTFHSWPNALKRALPADYDTNRRNE